MAKPLTPEQVNEQLAKTEARLKREAEAWAKRAKAEPATYQRTANTPRELRVLFADLCACRLTTGTGNRVAAVIADGFEPEQTMQTLARVLVESAECPGHKPDHMWAGTPRRVPEETEKRVRHHLRLLLEQLEANHG